MQKRKIRNVKEGKVWNAGKENCGKLEKCKRTAGDKWQTTVHCPEPTFPFWTVGWGEGGGGWRGNLTAAALFTCRPSDPTIVQKHFPWVSFLCVYRKSDLLPCSGSAAGS